MPVEVKTIGANGQLYLGKKYAGRLVTVDQVEEGVWMIKTAQVIPDNELWLHTPEMKASLDRAIECALNTPSQASDLQSFARRIESTP